MSVPKELKKTYAKQGYHIVGRHSAVKTCHWLRRSLNTAGEEYCYKQKFYGIPCHRCLQMTPSLGHCTQNCVFCWRATPEDLGIHWSQTQLKSGEVEQPQTIVEGCIKAHKKAMVGFGGNPNVQELMLIEAMQPIHAAISLEGEPTLYPKLGELVESFYDNGFKSVFIVTNGTQPRLLSNLGIEPSQLYVTVSAPDEATYNRVCKPMMSDGWRKLMETLDLMESFNCPTVLRHTLIPRLNMKDPSKYAKLAERAGATYLEPKAAKSVGYARKRFGYHEMAWHKDIRKFAEEIAAESGYEIIDEQPRSSVVLLSYHKKQKKLY